MNSRGDAEILISDQRDDPKLITQLPLLFPSLRRIKKNEFIDIDGWLTEYDEVPNPLMRLLHNCFPILAPQNYKKGFSLYLLKKYLWKLCSISSLLSFIYIIAYILEIIACGFGNLHENVGIGSGS